MKKDERIEALAVDILHFRKILHKDDEPGLSWPGLDERDISGRLTLKGANYFFLCSINDMMRKVEDTMEAAYNFMYRIAPDPEKTWYFISSHTLEEWMSKKKEYNLHWIGHIYKRNHRIAGQIVKKYNGDPRNIWEDPVDRKGLPPAIVAERLLDKDFGMGRQITYMTIGALKDNKILTGSSDIKADTHVTRTLGRMVTGDTISPDEAKDLARKMHPQDPWLLDEVLFIWGQEICKSRNPKCLECRFKRACAYFQNNFSEIT